jgi:hypothetical protein
MRWAASIHFLWLRSRLCFVLIIIWCLIVPVAISRARQHADAGVGTHDMS